MRLPKLTRPKLDEIKYFISEVFWGAPDKDAMMSIARQVLEQVRPGFHFADNLMTWGRNNSMLDDELFVKVLLDNAETDADRAIMWRRYILATSAYHAVQLDGDFVECGCYTGVAVKTVMDYLGGPEFPRPFWGYDVFERTGDELLHPEGSLHSVELFDKVTRKFADYPQVRILKGAIPGVFSLGMPERISFLHIDLNNAPSEIAALEALFDRVVPGGIIILDDYEWSLEYRAQKLAEDDWFEPRGYRVMPLPTGQGLLIKR
jgi:hypothetical protein